MKCQLQSSELTDFSFVPVFKNLTVPIDWPEWDLCADKPAFYPDDGEPEGYILDREHSELAAQQMPDLWRVVVVLGASELRVPTDEPFEEQILLKAESWRGADFFRANTTLHNYVSFRARQWLLEKYPAWLSCEPVETK